MDPDALREALDRWTDEGLIDEATATRIGEFEGVDAPGRGTATDATEATDATDGDPAAGLLGERRVVVALALMGGVLVAAGVAALLVERWESIPAALRATVLVLVPLSAAAGGASLERPSPRTAHGLWLLAALFTGVSLFQLAELATAVDRDAAEPWLVGGWTVASVVVAARIDSRPIGGLASALGAATVVTATTSETPVLLVGLYGSVAYAAGLLAGGGTGDRPLGAGTAASTVPRFARTLRWTGGTFATVAVVPLVATGARRGDPAGAGTALLAAVAAVAAAVAFRRAAGDRRGEYAVVPAVVGPVAVAAAWAAVGVTESLAGALVALGCLLVSLLALVVGAVGLREASLANAATLGFVLGVAGFLVGPIADAVSGSIALVAAGVILLFAGLGAERGRRAVLTRIG